MRGKTRDEIKSIIGAYEALVGHYGKVHKVFDTGLKPFYWLKNAEKEIRLANAFLLDAKKHQQYFLTLSVNIDNQLRSAKDKKRRIRDIDTVVATAKLIGPHLDQYIENLNGANNSIIQRPPEYFGEHPGHIREGIAYYQNNVHSVMREVREGLKVDIKYLTKALRLEKKLEVQAPDSA